MMQSVFIIHGSYGHPGENWFPWLKSELEELGFRVFGPKFPTPEGQKLNIWLNILKDYDRCLNENSVMVGHSMGCSLILRKLELLNKPIRAVFLVGGFTKDLWNGKYSDIIDTFFEKSFNWKKIKRNAKYFEIYQSNNDSLVPVSMGEEIAKNLNGELIIVKNAGHFNEDAGYTKFDLLLERIKKVLS
ncbi:MAG: serine hydrolase family protein [Candidatus Aenigmarchaeota archaeon]|nr:serine hydrolase family protein [Candidatus Aenigmarchaeota archaeon]